MAEGRNSLAVIIGQNVKALRTRDRLTQENIAQYLGIGQNLISMCENGERNFSAGMLEKLGDLFGCTPEALMQAEPPAETLDYAFRAEDVQVRDLEAIAAVNRIALNLLEMQRLKENDV